jgi:hypothetical protein
MVLSGSLPNCFAFPIVVVAPALNWIAAGSGEDNATTAISSALAAKPGGALDLGTPSTTLPKEATLPAEESAASSATKKDVQSLHWFVSIIIETIPFF